MTKCFSRIMNVHFSMIYSVGITILRFKLIYTFHNFIWSHFHFLHPHAITFTPSATSLYHISTFAFSPYHIYAFHSSNSSYFHFCILALSYLHFLYLTLSYFFFCILALSCLHLLQHHFIVFPLFHPSLNILTPSTALLYHIFTFSSSSYHVYTFHSFIISYLYICIVAFYC